VAFLPIQTVPLPWRSPIIRIFDKANIFRGQRKQKSQ
jgi:hypothetical protein